MVHRGYLIMAIFSHRIKQRQASKIHRLPFEWTTKSFSDILSDASSERLHQLQQPSFKSLVFKISTDQFNNDRGWATVDRQTIETFRKRILMITLIILDAKCFKSWLLTWTLFLRKASLCSSISYDFQSEASVRYPSASLFFSFSCHGFTQKYSTGSQWI